MRSFIFNSCAILCILLLLSASFINHCAVDIDATSVGALTSLVVSSCLSLASSATAIVRSSLQGDLGRTSNATDLSFLRAKYDNHSTTYLQHIIPESFIIDDDGIDQGRQSMSDIAILSAKRGEKIGSFAGLPSLSTPWWGESLDDVWDLALPFPPSWNHPPQFDFDVFMFINGKICSLTINKLTSLHELHNMIAKKESLSVKDLYLVCNGKPLPCNGSLVLQHPIYEGSTIFGYRRLRGGDTSKSERQSSGPSSPSRGQNKRARSSPSKSNENGAAAATDDSSGRANISRKLHDIMRAAETNVLAAKEIRQQIHALKFGGKLDKTKRGACKDLEEVATYLDAAANIVNLSINGVSDLKRLDRSWKLVLAKEERELIEQGELVSSSPLQRMRNLFHGKEVGSATPGKTSRSVKKVASYRSASLRPFVLNGQAMPRPFNGREYTPTEAVNILDAANTMGTLSKTGTTKQCRIVKDWLIDSGLVPLKSTTSLDKMYRKYRDGEPPYKWNLKGGQSICNVSDLIAEVKVELSRRKAKTWGRDNVRDALVSIQRKKLIDSGKDPESKKLEPDQATVDKYYGALSEDKSFIMTRKARPKPRTREIAETSLRSATSHLVTVAASSFIVDKPPTGRGIPADPSGGVDKLVDLIKESVSMGSDGCLQSDGGDDDDGDGDGDANSDGSPSSGDLDVYAVGREMLFSTDDTTVFYFTGKGDDGRDEWRIASKEESGKSYAYHRESDSSSDRFNGISVRLTVTMSGDGKMAPIVATVTGLTDKEIPRDKIPDGRVIVPVEGLCVGGGANPSVDQVGYVVMLRNDARIETKHFKWYSDTVRIPFVQKRREKVFNVSDNSHLTKDMTAILWSDGGIPQLVANTDEDHLSSLEPLRILECKHAAAGSAIQQPCDLSPVFRILKSLSRTHSVRPNKSSDVRKDLAKVMSIQENSSEAPVKLPDAKKNSLLDFISLLPDIISQAATRPNIIQGFVESGMLDEYTETTPDFYGLLNTMKRVREGWETKLVVDSFPQLYRYQIENGHVPDAIYDALGFPEDVDGDGAVVPKTASITQEHCQRAKCLSHPYQRKLRLNEIDEAARKIFDARETERIGRDKVLATNRDAEDKLHGLARRPATSGRRMLARTSMSDLIKLTIPQLKAMLHSRAYHRYNTRRSKTNEGYKFPKNDRKGSLEDVERCNAKEEANMDVVYPDDCLLYRVSRVIGETELKLRPLEYRSREAVSAANSPTETSSPLVLSNERTAGTDQPLPSVFLADADWIDKVRSSFLGVAFESEATAEMKERADALLPFARARIASQMKDRLRGSREDKHDHWCIKWAEENLSRLCAISVLAGHIVPSVKCSSAKDCLLRRPGRAEYKKALDPGNQNLAGCYLYYDEEKARFIRSGKVYGEGRDFKARNEDHKGGSLLVSTGHLDSRFYRSYPGENACPNSVSDHLKEGTFEDLVMYCGLGFKRISSGDLCSNDGILFWNEATIDSVKAVNFQCANLKDKQLHMVGYLCEIFYDILISPECNVSSSFGFETPLGIGGRSD